MSKIVLSRKNLRAIFSGLLVIFALSVIAVALSVIVPLIIIRNVSPKDFQTVLTQQPILRFNLVLKLLPFFSCVVGGAVVGWLVKENGWLYGGLLGLVLKLVVVAIFLFVSLLLDPLVYGQNISIDLVQKNILVQLIGTPLVIALTSLGGWLGEKLYEYRNS